MAASLNALRRWWLLDCAHHDTRGAAAFVGLSVAFVASIATACIDKPIVSAPVSGARASLSLAVSETHALAALARSIDIDASYSRTSGERVVLLRQSVPVTSTGTQQVPLQVDLSSCLADAQRDGGGSTCPLRLTILLRDSTSTGTLDSTEVGPIAAAPGASLSIVAPTADASPGGKGISGVTTFTFAAGAFSDPDAIYTWDFGDGSPAGNGLTATHTYTREGTFTATVHVSGAKTGTARTTVRVGSLTGSWIQTNAGSIFMRLVIAQQGASLSGTWYVMVPAGTPFSPVNNAAFSATALTGSVRSPNLVAMTQGGECQRVITQGSVDPELTVISGPATALNTACTNIGTQTFARDTAPPITSVVVSGGATSLLAGASTTFTATVTGGFNKQVIWTTSNPSVAGVNATGTVTANGTGTATITAIAIGDPTKTATAQVSVGSPKVVRSVIVTPSSTSIQVGGTTAFSAVVDADTGVDRSVKWSSSNAGVATVSGTGVVTGVAAGTATITATSVADASKSGSGTVTVIAAAVKSIVIKQGPDIPLGMKVSGDVTKNLTATLVFDPGADTTLVWSTANSSIATVTSTGALTGRGFGTTTVTAQSASTPTVSATSSVFVCGFPTIVSINNAVTGIPTNLGAVRDSIDVVIGGAAVTQPGVRSANVTIQAAAGSPLTQSPFIAAGSTSQVTSRINTRTLPNGTYLLSASIWDFVPGSSAVATAGCASTPVNITINNP